MECHATPTNAEFNDIMYLNQSQNKNGKHQIKPFNVYDI